MDPESNEKAPKSETELTRSEEIQEAAEQNEVSAQKKPHTPLDSAKPSKVRRFLHWYTHKKKLAVPLTIAVLLIILAAIPFTRYSVSGLFIKREVQLSVVDLKTKTPVSDAFIEIDGRQAKTDAEGKATVSDLPPGNHTVLVSKKYYKSSESRFTMPVFSDHNLLGVMLEATGRQTKVSVTNRISGAILADVTIKILGMEAKTDEKGEATIVLPAGTAKQEGTLTKTGFNDTKVTIEASETEIKLNKLSITPEGKLYFLSKRTGKIDVMKSNLDGSNAQVVLAGTGREDDADTFMLASRDWKYLALKSRREGQSAKLYLIETANDKLTVIDEGSAYFDLVGWNNESFIYVVDRVNIAQWQNNKYALKSFNATTKALKTIHETVGAGSGGFDFRYELLQSQTTFAFGGKIVFAKNASHSFGSSPQDSSIYMVNNDGSGLKKLKAFAPGNYIEAKAYAPEEVYFHIYQAEQVPESYLEYEDSVLKVIKKEDYEKQRTYPTFLLSPNGKMNLWSEQRDGKTFLFVGDEEAENETIIDQTTPFQPYGWFTDEYILIANRELAELFILPREWPKENNEKKYIKVTNYHKPARIFYGYGGL